MLGSRDFLAGAGEMATLMRAYDWTTTLLGAPEGWPSGLRTAVRLLLNSHHPMHIFWGPEATFFYNDGFVPSAGPERHPSALGRPASESWGEIWPVIGSEVAKVRNGGGHTWYEDQYVPILRQGRIEDAYWTYGFSPIDDDTAPNGTGGVISILTETTKRKALENSLRGLNLSLRAESDRLRDMFKQAPSFMAVLREPDHRFELTNDAYQQLIGGRDMIGLPVREALGEVAGQPFFDLLDGVYKTGEPFIGRGMEIWLERTPGAPSERRVLDFIYQPIRDHAGAVVGIFVEGTDVTDMHAATEELREREQRLHLIVEAATDYAIMTTDGERIVTGWSAGASEIFGYAAEEIIGRSADVLFTPEDRKSGQPIEELADARAEGRAPDVRWHLRKDGTRVFLNGSLRVLHDAAGRELGFLKIARDETERRASDLALRELNASLEQQVTARVQEIAAQGKALDASQARQRVVFDLTRQLMGIMELDGTLLEANPASLEAIGAELTDVVGRPFWLTPWFTSSSGVSDLVKGAVGAASNGRSIRTELPLLLPNGETRIYDFGMHPVRDKDGRVIEIMPEATDITELRKAEEALRQSQKMEAVGQLTGGLAHDFNNLLAGISGSLEMMQNRLQQGRFNDVERYMTVAQGASKRAAALTHRLLAFSRRQTLDPKPTDVNRLVTGMHEMVQRTVGPGIPVEVVGASDLWPALVDPSQLENALLNLCINARDAMPDGGRITVETHNKWLDERASCKLDMPEGQYLSLCVTDTGTGMSPTVIARVFEPFFTTKPIGEGTGLGLSMIYGFAQQSGGQVRIYSEVGEGSTICIYLPRHYGKVEDEEGDAKLAALDRSDQGETVLVVDDEPSVRMLITDILEDLGYLAIEAGDSAAGLKVLQSDVRIDLLVTDVGLPGGMNGRQMADAAHSHRPGLKVLFITGYAENAILGNGTLPPGMAVLTKPFAMDAMATRIRSLIEADKEDER
ncbi:PAS domain-containing protein [Methylobacterium sp. J-030]|uniref:PAS domain-containing hybrid sensor histidine kinase/response regulator n=1 Tax=Methylobacterium sp. J-030 TaxID=2836627 RepID=UPI001FB8A10A|nr:PAS domain-containing protein [Methylobacterium sp. J-030]MCJ2069604.1 PAS domain-containing protein [Methylobacterium sp. J-030]